MNKLTRRNFLLSTGVAALAAPVLANTSPDASAEKQLAEMIAIFDNLSPKGQQKTLADYDRLTEQVYPDGEITDFNLKLKRVLIKRAKPIN